MLWIGRHLQRLGHDVSMLTSDAHRDEIEASGLAFVPLDATVSPPPDEPSRLMPNLIRRYLTGKADIRSTFVAPLIAQHRALDRVLRDAPVDVVLCDLAFTGALPLVTSNQPRPTVVVCGVGPLTLSSADTPPFGMAWIPRPGMDYGGMHAVVHRVMFRDIHNQLNDALYAVGAGGIDVSLMDWPLLADRLVQLTIPDSSIRDAICPPTSPTSGRCCLSRLSISNPRRGGTKRSRPKPSSTSRRARWTTVTSTNSSGPAFEPLADVEGVAVIVTTGRREDRTAADRCPRQCVCGGMDSIPRALATCRCHDHQRRLRRNAARPALRNTPRDRGRVGRQGRGGRASRVRRRRRQPGNGAPDAGSDRSSRA